MEIVFHSSLKKKMSLKLFFFNFTAEDIPYAQETVSSAIMTYMFLEIYMSYICHIYYIYDIYVS